MIGHQYDIIHPFSDAGMLAEELPNGRLLQARSLVELRVAPRRLTDEIAAFIDDCWKPRAAARACARVLIAHSAANLTRRRCRVARKRKNAASASAKRSSRPRRRLLRAASACS